MSISIPDRVVVFDYGEVISRSPSEEDTALLLQAAGASAVEFWPVYSAHRDELDEGVISVDQYWDRIASELSLSWTPGQRHEIWVRDFRCWFSTEPGTVDLLAELRDGGTRVALLSNAGFDFGDPFRFSPMAAYFERLFVSAELHLAKPDPAIYRHVADELGIGFDRFVFIDNKKINVDALVALGGTGHVFVGAAELRVFLESLARVSPGVRA
ncbi:HAD family phosphatase [soil metagenome]